MILTLPREIHSPFPSAYFPTKEEPYQDEQRLLRSGMETHVFLEICLGHEALSLCSHLYEFKEQWLEYFARKIP